jgi:L-asparaginase II
MSDQLLVEVTRNDIVESRHLGSAVVCDNKGHVLHSLGDINQLIFPRSALKPTLAIDLVKSGASNHYSLSDVEISMACTSHQGEPMHQELVSGWLDRLGLGEKHLASGADLPDDIESAHNLLISGRHSCRVHPNCSGKHTVFLNTALHSDMPLEDFHLIDHPLQQLTMEGLSELAGINIRDYPMGIDGCGFPAPTMPLFNRPRDSLIHQISAMIAHKPFYGFIKPLLENPCMQQGMEPWSAI